MDLMSWYLKKNDIKVNNKDGDYKTYSMVKKRFPKILS
jgi:hypothetical protein